MQRVVLRRLSLPIVLLILLAGCAAKGPRAKAQIGALTVGEAVLGISNAEQVLARANLAEYPKATQDVVNAGILKALYASRAFERAAANWAMDGSLSNDAVDKTVAGLTASLHDLEQIVPSVASVHTPLVATIRAALVAIETWRASR